jgi:phage-related protein
MVLFFHFRIYHTHAYIKDVPLTQRCPKIIKIVNIARNNHTRTSIRFLEIFAEKIISTEKFLTKKCKTFDSTIRVVIEGVLDVLSDLATVLSIVIYLVLPFLDATICGLNNLLAAIVVAIQGALSSVWPGRNRNLEDSANLFDSNTDVRTAFLRVLEHIDDPGIKPVILKILDLNADRIHGKSILDFFMESMGEEDPTFAQDERRINMMIANVTEIGHRYLSYKEISVDITSLQRAVGAINDATQAFETIDKKLEEVFTNVVVPAREFANAVVEPFENISKILEPFQPVVDVISEIIDAISWLQCPDELGFICDLGNNPCSLCMCLCIDL